jgi:hypothetical protein
MNVTFLIDLGKDLVKVCAGAGFKWVLDRPASSRNKAYDKVNGTIDAPLPNATILRTSTCSGVVTGMQPGSGLSLWVAVERGGGLWPRDHRVQWSDKNEWCITLFEDGPLEQKFSVALYVVNTRVDRRITKWLAEGARRGDYPQLNGLPGARRLARVDGVSLATSA